MNYEELLAARNSGRMNPTRLPIGDYYREQTDGKYRGVVDVRQDMQDNIVFCEALKQECEANKTLRNPHQLHFEPVMEGGDVRRLMIELGTFMSVEQLINDNPAVVVEEEFAVNLLKGLVEATSYLHSKGIRHICFSPKTVFVRKGDMQVLLLSHGSYYMGIKDVELFYGGDVKYVAPEVLNHGTIDNRCDVYSIGCFMEEIFTHSSTPLEFKRVVKKAVSQSPEDRYETPEDMLQDMKKWRSGWRTTMMLVGAFVVALICLGLYMDMVPETTQVDFVKPAPRLSTDDLIEDGYDPAVDLGVTVADSITDEDRQARRDYQAKAEAIFRKNYEKEADRILSKIYNKDYMSNSEKQFLSQSRSTLEELMQAQQQMGKDAGLTLERSQLIASEIIDRITNQKKKEMGGTNSRGVQLPK
ncbi:MAG: protein kinase family protein [Prevotella sp.]|nr:protein kinase family protein [Prevotella sp.]